MRRKPILLDCNYNKELDSLQEIHDFSATRTLRIHLDLLFHSEWIDGAYSLPHLYDLGKEI